MLNSKRLPINIQLFAEGDPPPANNQEPPAGGNPAPNPSGKTYSEDYVHSLRNEAAGHRTTAKTYENALRKALNVADNEELGDIDKRISQASQAHETALQNAMKKANDRLIVAEIRSLEGYEHKLLLKVIDLSKVTVDDNGEVKGLDEAVKAAEAEYPAVKKTDVPPYYAGGTGNHQMNNNSENDDYHGEISRALFGKE